jgi:hypothetical protein
VCQPGTTPPVNWGISGSTVGRSAIGVTVSTTWWSRAAEPTDPKTKGGSEATVRMAKADLASTDAKLLDDYSSLAALERVARHSASRLNARPHAACRTPHAALLVEERGRSPSVPGVSPTPPPWRNRPGPG